MPAPSQNKTFQKIPSSAVYLFFVYLLGLFFFTSFRLLLVLVERRQFSTIPQGNGSLIAHAFFNGFRFDTNITCYFIALPAVILTLLAVTGIQSRFLERVVRFVVNTLFIVGFLICAIDIPFYSHFLHRVSWLIFSWTDTPLIILGMIVKEPKFIIYLLPFLIACFITVRLNRIIFNRIFDGSEAGSGAAYKAKIILISILVLVLIFLGIRGRVAIKSPLTVGIAYFSDYAFLNQLGLNPVYSLIISYLTINNAQNKKIHLESPEKALAYAGRQLKASGNSMPSPVARKIVAAGEPLRLNIVVIIMEAMSTEKLGHYGDKRHLTPCLDSIAAHSISFKNAYAAGNHTYNGVYATLFSLPTVMHQHPFHLGAMVPHNGIISFLRDKGYYTMYFTTHDNQFDNIGGFLRANGFNRVVSQKDYNSGDVLSTLGVPDHVMFDFSMPQINALSQKGTPFFAAFLTASDHEPNIIPPNISFTPHSGPLVERIVEYADWSIGRFMDAARKEKWFSNTLFVFVADHGTSFATSYPIPLSHLHVPLILYAPSILKQNADENKRACQIDIMPTVMGLLNLPYTNNTLGIDLLKEERPYAYFSIEDFIGCIDSTDFAVTGLDGKTSLYKYRHSDPKNYADDFPLKAALMKEYALSMLQTTQWMFDNSAISVKQKDRYK